MAPRDPSPLVAFKETWRLPKDQLVLDGISTKSLREGREILEAFVAFERELSESSQMRPGMREVLARLRQLETRLALLTNNHQASAEIALAKHRLEFDLVLTRDQARLKPAPDLLLKALDHFALRPSEVLYVGDSKADKDAAQAAGVEVLFLATPHNHSLAPRYQTAYQLWATLEERIAAASS